MTEELLHEDRLYRLIQSIREVAGFAHPVEKFELVETHISYILLTGPFAYKFKKPLDLGFLNFSTLARRKFYCEEELRLNKRLAPELYLEVVPITGSERSPKIGGSGKVIEYAVKMNQFDRRNELDKMLEEGQLSAFHVDNLTDIIYRFHNSVSNTPPSGILGSPATIAQYALDNFTRIEAVTSDDQDYQPILERLRDWTKSTFTRLSPRFQQRREQGFVRECHGDLHLGNMAMHDNKLLIFDCIEFSQALHWIDIMSECAFLVMDLDARGHPQLGHRFINRYLQLSGDYEGLALLRFYMVYRALVRCKVACIRLGQSDSSPLERHQETGNYRHYLELADSYICPATPILCLTYGLSGSGKTFHTQALLEQLPAIRLRSDVERKRMHGFAADAKTETGVETGIYSAASSLKTYEKLATLARILLNAGYSVIVDATFLKQAHREIFQNLAASLNLSFVILDFQADKETLQQRITQRHDDASEADLGILEYQLKIRQPLNQTELKNSIIINTETGVNPLELIKQIQKARV